MSDTKISYVDKVWNPITGCSKACSYCYAAGIARRFWGKRPFSDVRCHADRLDQPFHWKKPARIFVNSMGDIFDKKVKGYWLDQIQQVMEATPRHTYLLLTKVPENISVIEPADNIWVGVTVESAEQMHRVNTLMEKWKGKRWVSFEPLMGPVQVPMLRGNMVVDIGGIDWVVVGGMSGRGATAMKTEWARDIYQTALINEIPFYFKQWGRSRIKSERPYFRDMEETKEIPQ